MFFGWGLALAVSSVLVAPFLQRRFGLVPTLSAALVLVAADLAVLGLGVGSRAVLVAGVVVAGLFLGVVNTVLTETVMLVSPFERPVASAAYASSASPAGRSPRSLAGKLAEHVSVQAPVYVGAVAVATSIAVLLLTRRAIAPAAGHQPATSTAVAPALAATASA